MVSVLVGCLIGCSTQKFDFGPVVQEADYRNKPLHECVAELEKVGEFKVTYDYQVDGSVTLLARNLPALVILDMVVFQQNARIEKREGTLHVVRSQDSDAPEMSRPFERASLVSGLPILAKQYGIPIRCEAQYASDHMFHFTKAEHGKAQTWFLRLIRESGASFEIVKGVYVVRDGYWSVPKKLGGGAGN